MALTFITLNQLEQDNEQKTLKSMFKNAYPELGQSIDGYFGNDNFLSKEEMAAIIEKRQFNEHRLIVHVNKKILSNTGRKILSPADRKVGKTVSKFLTDLFLGFGFIKVGKKVSNGLKY